MTPSPPPSLNQVRIALFLSTLGGLLFTLDLPLLRLSMADHWTMVFARGTFLFLAVAAAWAFAAWRRGTFPPFISGWAGVAVALTSTVGNMSYIGAVAHTNAANVVFIIALTPIIAAALSRLALREPVHPFTWAATLTALLGGLVIASEGLHSGNWMGDGLAFVSAFCSATIFTVIRATGRDVATSLALGSLSAALVALAVFGAEPLHLLEPGAWGVPAWGWLALNGFIAIPLGTVLLARGPRTLPSADVSMFFMLETVLTPLWIWLLFSEAPSPRVLAGGALVVLTLLTHGVWRFRQSLQAA